MIILCEMKTSATTYNAFWGHKRIAQSMCVWGGGAQSSVFQKNEQPNFFKQKI